MNTPANSANSANLPPGTRIAAYRIERSIASGGMADVYYAIHQGLHRPAAIKVLRPALAADQIHLQRFMQEARAAASLIHPNIVQVYDVGQDGQHPYIAQEFIPGSNLRQYLASPELLPVELLPAEKQPAEKHSVQSSAHQPHWESTPTGVPLDRQLPLRETLSILLQVLAALSKSAASGIVHRDIKPENIMLTPDGDAKVTDFGLARILFDDDPHLTRAGTTLGTPMYMSPEQIQEGQVDIRSDLYSLGVTLYHMLCGRPPFKGETPLALAMQHVQATAPDIVQFRSDLPPSLIALVERLLLKRPEDRFQSPAEAIEFLRAHRYSDLQTAWPDHTIPLPGVSNAHGPLPATLTLQAKLRGGKSPARRSLLWPMAVVAFLITTFGLGAMLAFETPFRLFESQEDFFWDIAKQSSAEQQYRWALLNTDANQIAKWEAIGHFFPKQDKPLNRLYVGLANLQLARAHFDRKETELAHQKLRETIDDKQVEQVIRALAYLQLAEIAEDGADFARRDQAVEQAILIATAPDMVASDDLPRLNDNVRLLDPVIQKIWFERIQP